MRHRHINTSLIITLNRVKFFVWLHKQKYLDKNRANRCVFVCNPFIYLYFDCVGENCKDFVLEVFEEDATVVLPIWIEVCDPETSITTTQPLIITLCNRWLNCALCVMSIAIHYFYWLQHTHFFFTSSSSFRISYSRSASRRNWFWNRCFFSRLNFVVWRARAQTRA